VPQSQSTTRLTTTRW